MGEKQITSTKETRVNDEQLNDAAEKQREALRDKLDTAEQSHKEHGLSEEQALTEAKDLAERTKPHDKRPNSPAERRRGTLSKKQLAHAYDLQLEQAREHMNPANKALSKVIHNRTVETVSETVGATVARPNALLSGSIAAFAAVTVLYFFAKHYGYQLSGFETIGAFVAGWALGLLFDYFSLLIRGR